MTISGFAGIDVVNGLVIGGDERTGQLFYEGRPQGGQFYGDTDLELRQEARNRIEKLKTDCGEAFQYIFKNNDPKAWELRIWD